MRLARGRIWRTNLLQETCGQNHRECWGSYRKGRGGLRARSRKSRGFLEERVQGLLLPEYGHLLIEVFSFPAVLYSLYSGLAGDIPSFLLVFSIFLFVTRRAEGYR